MAVIGAVTDDFTGTASAGVFIARSGAKTGLFFDADAVKNFEDANRLDAIFVSSNSRHLKPEEAYERVAETTNALRKMDVIHFSKKIDTTLRGGIGYEIDAMLDILGEDTMAVMVTAMPQSRRICVGGFSIIDGCILTETPVAHDVKTPVKECFVPALIQKQTKRKVELITLQDVLKGAQELKSVMQEARERGGRVLIVDAITMEHVDTIAKACVELKWKILAVDPGAFTMKLSYRRGLIREERPNLPLKTDQKMEKTALIVAGSANPSTKTQMELLCKQDGRNVMVPISPYALLQGGETALDEVKRAAKEIVKLFGEHPRPRAVVVETALHGEVVNLKEEDEKHGYEPGTCSELINSGLALITEQVLESVGQNSVSGLMLTGGDTMESVCRKIGVSCIQALDNIVAQVDVGCIIGRYEGLPLIVKGGFCGYDEIGLEIVDRLFLEAGRDI